MNERDILAQKDFAVKEALLKGEAKGRAEGLAEGKAKGRSEGLAEGETKGKRETAKNLKAMGLSVEQIIFATGLSQKEIQHL